LEKRLPHYHDLFMKNVFRFVIDGVEPGTIKDIFENEIYVEEERLLSGAKVYMDAGGFSPTVGIIGAVLGLIHVMENLTDTSKLGSGIAVAFVATVYGVGSANLIFIPLANKIKKKIKERSKTKEMILIGAISVLNGLNPYIIEEKMKAYLQDGSEL
jgi:chemotaxis protein MotA